MIDMTFQEAMLMTLLILGIMYSGLYLYFEHRLDKKNKEWQKRKQHLNSEKI